MSKEYPLNVPAPHHFTFAVRDIPDVTVEQRERVLKATHYNGTTDYTKSTELFGTGLS